MKDTANRGSQAIFKTEGWRAAHFVLIWGCFWGCLINFQNREINFTDGVKKQQKSRREHGQTRHFFQV